MSTFTRRAATAQTLSVNAMEEASRTGQREADIDHMFIALVINEQVAGQVLRGLGITLDTARQAVAAQHAAQLESLGITARLPDAGRISFHETGGYEWSNRAAEVIKRANDRGKDGDAAAVLRDLLAEPSGLIVDVLGRLRTSPEEVSARLDEAERMPTGPVSSAVVRPLSGSAEAFVAAPVEDVWRLLGDPARMSEWDPAVGGVAIRMEEDYSVPGTAWDATARSHRPDGKSLRVKPERQRQHVTLLVAEENSRIAWRFTYPDAPRANARQVEIALEHTTGGTRLSMTLTWERDPSRRDRPVLGRLLRPVQRFGIWTQLTGIGNGISRVFR